MNKNKTKNIGRIALLSAVISVCGWITVPSAVPFTMQTFGVLLAAVMLGGKGAAAAVAGYIALGLLGLPVFSGGSGGIGVLFGATGGYIMGFLPCAYISGRLCEKTKKRPIVTALSLLLGLLCDYILGVLWLALIYLEGLQSLWLAAVTGVLPFVVPDILKLALAMVIGARLQKIL